MGSRFVFRALLVGCLVLVGFVPAAWGRFQPATCSNSFTPEQEQAEGAKVAAEVYKQMPVLPDSDLVSRYVRELGMRLVQQAPGLRWQYNFHVVASDDINAFALPGGSIFVNLGTVRAAETEAQLAGVMAHEISHVVMRHSTCNISKQQKVGLLAGLAQIGSAMVLGDGALGSAVTQGIGMSAGLGFLRMSRDAEKQADLLGAGILYDSGYDPRGLPQFFETIQAKYGAGGAQIFTDHPNPGNRTEYVNAEIATLPPRAKGTVTSAAFVKAHTRAMEERVFAAKEVQAGVWKQVGGYAAGPGSAGSAGVETVSQGGVSSGPASGTAPAGQGGAAASGGAGSARLGVSALGLKDKMVKLQGTRFSMSYPQSWQTSVDASGSATLAPVGGGGAAGIAYGAFVSVEKQTGDGVSDGATLAAATTALVQKLSQQNGGLSAVGQMQSLVLRGQIAQAVELRGQSSVVERGRPLQERDWLVTVARTDGDMNYIVFVAPEADLATMRSLFTVMMRSFRGE